MFIKTNNERIEEENYFEKNAFSPIMNCGTHILQKQDLEVSNKIQLSKTMFINVSPQKKHSKRFFTEKFIFCCTFKMEFKTTIVIFEISIFEF